MHSGEYLVEFPVLPARATGSIIYLMNNGREIVHIVPAIAGNRRFADDSSLVFNRYGDKYFLSEIRQGAVASALPRSRAEKETALAQSGRAPSRTVVIAEAN